MKPPYVTHCNPLQHTVSHCNTLQHTATAYLLPPATLAIVALQVQILKKNEFSKNMYTYIHVCEYVYAYIHVYGYIYVYIHTYMYPRALVPRITGWRRLIGCL